MSDIEGKAAMGSGEEGGSRTSFNTDFHGFDFLFSALSVSHPCKSVAKL
jgi:hypothetical protein